MALTLSITESAMMKALGDFITDVLDPAVEVAQAQDNYVPEPGVVDFVLMTPLRRIRLATNKVTYDTSNPAPVIQSIESPTQIEFQLDIHGPNSGDNTEILKNIFRDTYACTFFAATGLDIQPLYMSEPLQAPFVNGENQYETRWTMDAVLQANPVMTVPQDFADTVVIGIIEVDTTYPA